MASEKWCPLVSELPNCCNKRLNSEHLNGFKTSGLLSWGPPLTFNPPRLKASSRRKNQGDAQGGRQKELDHFLIFGHFSVSFCYFFSSLSCHTPFAGLFLQQGERRSAKNVPKFSPHFWSSQPRISAEFVVPVNNLAKTPLYMDHSCQKFFFPLFGLFRKVVGQELVKSWATNV